jgi:hypothetical protein
MENIYPCIILSENNEENNYLSYFDQNKSDLFRNKSFNFYSTLYISEGKINRQKDNANVFTIPENLNKSETRKHLFENRDAYLSIFNEELFGDEGILNLGNTRRGNENGFRIMGPICVVMVFKANSKILNPLLFTFLENRTQIQKSMMLHLIIDFDSQNIDKEYKANCIANFKEIDHYFNENEQINNDAIKIWCLDDINEERIAIGSAENKYGTITNFIELLSQEHDAINGSNYSWKKEYGKQCILSSFGYSKLSYPVREVEKYIGIYSVFKELLGIQENDLTRSHDRLKVKTDLDLFYRDHEYKGISGKIVKLDGEEIFKKINLGFDTKIKNEDDSLLSKKLSLIENPKNRSSSLSLNFFSDIQTAEKKYKSNTIPSMHSDLEKSRGHHKEKLFKIIEDHTSGLLDSNDYGIIYAKIFNHILLDEESKVANHLSGPMVNFTSLTDLEGEIRNKLIGDRLSNFEGNIETNSNFLTNNTNTIKEYQAKIEELKESLKEFELSDLKESDPKFIEKEQELKSLNEKINELQIESTRYKNEIKRNTDAKVNLETEYDKNAYKDDLKRKLNPPVDQEIEEFQQLISSVDEKLGQLFESKNSTIEEWKKFRRISLIIIPSAILLVLIIAQVILYYKTSWYDFLTIKKIGLPLTLITLVVYFIWGFLKFKKIENKLKLIIQDAKEGLNKKLLALQQLLQTKNNYLERDFLFEAEVRGLATLKEVKDKIKIKADALNTFTDAISENSSTYQLKRDEFKFVNTDFENTVIDKPIIENKYAENKVYKVPSKQGNTYASYFEDFENNDHLKLFIKDIQDSGARFFKEYYQSVGIEDIIYGKIKHIPHNKDKVDTKLIPLKSSSQPFLVSNNSEDTDVNLKKIINVGKLSNTLKNELDQLNTNVYSEDALLQKNNDKVIGVLTLKSNIPIANASEFYRWEKEFDQDKSSFENLFINDSDRHHSFDFNDEGPEDSNNHEVLIIALSEGFIQFNENGFTEPSLGNLGTNYNALKKTWGSSGLSHLRNKVENFQRELKNYNEEEFKEHLHKIPVTAKNLKLKGSNRVAFQNYFLSNQGGEDKWNELYNNLK